MAYTNGNGNTVEVRTSPGPPREYQNACYYHSSSVYHHFPPSRLDPTQITILYYSSSSIARDGTVLLRDFYADTRMNVDGHEGCLRACLALKQKNPALKVLLSIGNDDSSQAFSSIVGHHDSAEKFARSAKSLVEQYNLDGVDVCWRFLQDHNDGDDLLRLLSRVRKQLGNGYLLTTAVSGNHMDIRKISEFQFMAQIVNYFNLFAMDFSGSFSRDTKHQSQLYSQFNRDASCHSLVTQLNVSLSKIMLGIPTYGRSFIGATHVGQRFVSMGGVNGVFAYKDLPRPDAHENFDTEAHAAFCAGGDGGFVTYDNPQSVCSKARYVTHNGMAGLFFTDAMNDGEGDRSLIRAGLACLKCPPP